MLTALMLYIIGGILFFFWILFAVREEEGYKDIMEKDSIYTPNMKLMFFTIIIILLLIQSVVWPGALLWGSVKLLLYKDDKENEV